MINRAAILLVLLSSLCFAQVPDATSEVNAGVQSYKNARYEEAIEHFKRATELDPTLLNARIYLATAYAMQYVPGIDTGVNLHMANLAIEQYKKVLEADPNNVNSVKGIAYLNLNMKKFEEAKQWYNKASEIDPNDPEAYYSAGVIDWTQAYQARMDALAKLKIKPSDSEQFIDSSQCRGIRDKNSSNVDDGIKHLTKTLELRPDYDDAMAYMNLLFRERASLHCGDHPAYQKDADTADKWVDVTMMTKKKKMETQKLKSDQ